MQKNAESLVFGSKETGLQVNVDKTKYIVISRDETAGQITISPSIIVSLKGWNSSNIWEQP